MPRQRKKSNVYTGTGDRGMTGLFGGRRVAKDHPRIQTYGAIDELNSTIGLAASYLRQRRLKTTLQSIQNELFNIGAELSSAKPVRRKKKDSAIYHLQRTRAEWLESLIDEYDARVPPLTTFVLPSGTTAAAALHVARTVCRRAERLTVTLARKETINPAITIYLNRLSDLLFVLSRYVNKTARQDELLWHKDG